MKFNSLTAAVTLVSAAGIFTAAAYNGMQIDANNELINQHSAEVMISYPDVAVINVVKDNYQAQIKGYGEVKARYQLTLSSEVSGRVEFLDEKFESGQLFDKNAELVRLNAVSYQQAAAGAQAAVADAEYAFLEEQRQSQQAKLEWRRSGMQGEPDSPLVLREPQLAAAQANLNNARRQLEKAQSDLDKTTIAAPFDALVITRDVQPGSYLQAGNTVATLYSTDRVEITVPLSNQQWQNLPPSAALKNKKRPVKLSNSEGTSRWTGYVDRVEKHLDSSSRQRSLVVVVEKPFTQSEPLFPGTFVEAQVQGDELNDLWKVPASAVSQNGYVWYISETNNLARFKAEKVFELADAAYIKPMGGLDSAQIVVRPLNSYVQGMTVTPKVENGLEEAAS
ncbi:efflux RND transporter periplasmic adaptor subunit [Psychromonas aquimarina]|uniref:efflux RND transporter periplasmic adaptor subunit n=1 Tax=Psychromonas aquimarina TaxID=444919 RepID=UPI0004144740|nr:efflux RND transporter periplasmic adaptor subunit [Psychromonas aquimarina]